MHNSWQESVQQCCDLGFKLQIPWQESVQKAYDLGLLIQESSEMHQESGFCEEENTLKCFIWGDKLKIEYIVFTDSVENAREIMRKFYNPGQDRDRIINSEPEIREIPQLIVSFDPGRLLWKDL